MAYANGRLPTSQLRTLPGTNERVRSDVYDQTVAMMNAFRAHFGYALRITDGYRSYEQQVAVKKTKGRLAATPGYSNHGLGLALDLGSGVQSFGTAEHRWMVANAARFGYYLPAWAQRNGSKPEAWHWETRGAVPASRYQSTPGIAVPAPRPPAPPAPIITKDWFDMASEAQLDELLRRHITPLLAEIGRIGTRLKDIQVADEFAAAWYQEYLGRPASPGDRDHWTRFVADGQPLSAVRLNISGSDEAKNARRRAVREAYITLLGRLPESQARVDAWAEPVQALASLRQAIAASQEAQDFAKLPAAERQKRIDAARAADKK